MMIRKLVTARIALVFGLSLAVLACTDDDQNGDDAAEGTDETGDGDTGNAEAGDGDGDGDGDSGNEEVGDGDGDPAGDGDGDPAGDGDGDPTGDGDGDADAYEQLLAACVAHCDLFSTCYFPIPGCVEACSDLTDVTGECVYTLIAVEECAASLTCEEYQAFLEEGTTSACAAEVEADLNCQP